MRTFLAMGLALCALTGAWGGPKLIYHGWDTLSATPEEILENAAAFETAGCDGVAVCLKYETSGGKKVDSNAFMNGPEIAWADVERKVHVLKAIAAKRGLESSLLQLLGSPATRIPLADDAAWVKASASFGTLARLAKEGGLPGLLVDFEDYRKAKQFIWIPEADGIGYAAAVKLMRQRGAEFFGAAFRAFPEMEFVSFQLFANDTEYGAKERDPRRLMRKKRDLWPAFLNGMLDVLPETAHFTDGDENAYHYRAARRDFDRAATRQRTDVLPLVAPKNRAKYRAQMRVGFGLYLDGYIVDEKNPWCQPPMRGSRLAALDDNLRDAVRACDGFVWIYGEKRAFIPWQTKEWTVLTRDWVKKPTWEDALPGFVDVMTGAARPADLVARRFAEQAKAGTLVNLAAGRSVGTNGNFSATLSTPVPHDSYYGITFTSRAGSEPSAMVAWQKVGGWLWGHESYADYAKEEDGRTRGYVLARVPEEAVRMYLSISRLDEQDPDPEIRNVVVFRIK